MGKLNRERKLELEWLHNYAKEATGIIIDFRNLFYGQFPEELMRRIDRLKAASKLWDEIRRQKEVFVP